MILMEFPFNQRSFWFEKSKFHLIFKKEFLKMRIFFIKKIIFQNFFIKIKNLWIYSSSWSLLKKLPKSHNSFDSL